MGRSRGADARMGAPNRIAPPRRRRLHARLDRRSRATTRPTPRICPPSCCGRCRSKRNPRPPLRPRRLPHLHRYLLGLKYIRGSGARPLIQFGNRLQGIGGVANMFAADDHECTLALAEVALQQIRALRMPASPRNFEIWYHYATGQRADLNHHINSVLARKGSLDDGDLEQTYRAFFSPNRMSDRIETVG